MNYMRLSLEEEEESSVIIADGEIKQARNTYVLVGRFLT